MKTLAKKSPFGIFENETLVKIQPTVSRSLFINDIEATILKALNKVIVSTSSLLFRQLNSHAEIPDQDTVKVALNKLWKSGYVEKYHFTNAIDGTYSAGKVYVPSYRARGYLKSVGVTPNKTMYMQNIIVEDNSAQIKRILSAQQFALSYGADDFKIAETIFIPHKSGNAKHIFRPQAIVNTTDRTLFVESVRDDIGELDRLTEKLHRIAEVCKRMKANIEINNPTVVLVAEDSTHQDYIKSELENKLKLNNIKLKITNDLDIYYGKSELIDINLHKPSFLDLFIERKAS